MNMSGLKLVVLLALMITALYPALNASAKVRIEPPENMQATDQELTEIAAFFDSIEDALAKEDIDRVMSYYADSYFHRGITKEQVKGIWQDIFSKYDKLHSVHVFSKVVVVDDEALVVCTGTLLGVPAGSKNKRYVTIDTWAEQNHHIYKIKGSWMITGGSSHRMTKGKSVSKEAPKRPLGFHPLY